MKKYIIVLAVALMSCEDQEQTTTVRGKVINFGSREPVEGVKVILQDGVGNSGFSIVLETGSGRAQAAITDERGEFRLSIKGKFEPFIAVRGDSLYTFKVIREGAGQGIMGVPHGATDHKLELEVMANSYFAPILMSKASGFQSDTIVFSHIASTSYGRYYKGNLDGNYFYKTSSCYSSGSGSTSCFIGEGPFDIKSVQHEGFKGYRCIGHWYQPYYMMLIRDGVKKVWLDSVYIKSFETYRDTIYY